MAAAESIRLVIWDLDETFWRGTLTEGGITAYVRQNHDAVVALAERGIISSICSKNDPDAVRAILETEGLWDYFVFPSISWAAKGPRIQEIIKDVQLRPETVMFIDDNHGMRAEAAALVPGLYVADETILPHLLDHPRLVGKDDKNLTRLKSYQVLQKKSIDRSQLGTDNEAFLHASGVSIGIEPDIEAHMDRAIELIQRTNQLNFTKIRLPSEPAAASAALREQLAGFDVRAGLVNVQDNYGDYGFCGFFLMSGHWKARRLEHFVFSCRALDMGVEQWMYDRLGRPDIDIRGEVMSSLDRDVTWISLRDNHSNGYPTSKAGVACPVRLRGGCDLEVLSHYFDLRGENIISEVIYGSRLHVVQNHTSTSLVTSMRGLPLELASSMRDIGFEPDDFTTQFFIPSDAETVFIFNCVGDANVPIYAHKETGALIPIGSPGYDFRDITKMTVQDIDDLCREREFGIEERAAHESTIEKIKKNFNYIGLPDEDMVTSNLRLIFSHIPRDRQFFCLLSNDSLVTDQGRHINQRIADVNRWTTAVAQDFESVRLLNFRDYIFREDEVKAQITHYDRMVYFRMFQDMQRIITERHIERSKSGLYDVMKA